MLKLPSENMKYHRFTYAVIFCFTKAIEAKAQNGSSFMVEQFGSLYSDDFRLFFRRADTNTPISPMHDIPL